MFRQPSSGHHYQASLLDLGGCTRLLTSAAALLLLSERGLPLDTDIAALLPSGIASVVGGATTSVGVGECARQDACACAQVCAGVRVRVRGEGWDGRTH